MSDMSWAWDDLLAWRQRMGWTQKQAGQQLGRSRQMISNYEGNLSPIPLAVELACQQLEKSRRRRPKRAKPAVAGAAP